MNPTGADMALAVRRAIEADLPAIVALLADDPLDPSREEPGLPLDARYRTGFLAVEADPNQLLAVAILGEDIVGTLQISFIPGVALKGAWHGQIEAVRIASRLRGRGFGRQLIVWAIEECRKRGCGVVQLTTNRRRVDAHAFYEKLGFEESHKGFKIRL
jgi:GNAT superfamily N-acetyltransferase